MDDGRETEEKHSAPSEGDSAAPAASMRRKMFSIKIGKNAKGSAASKASLMRDSDASLTLIGEIIHRDSEYIGEFYSPNRVAKVLFKAGVQDTFPSTAIHSRSTKRYHQLKIFQTG
jgi:hypothetical protein